MQPRFLTVIQAAVRSAVAARQLDRLGRRRQIDSQECIELRLLDAKALARLYRSALSAAESG
jgi:hypothetical protein